MRNSFAGNGATILQQVSAAAYNVLTDLALVQVNSKCRHSFHFMSRVAGHLSKTLLLSSRFCCVFGPIEVS